MSNASIDIILKLEKPNKNFREKDDLFSEIKLELSEVTLPGK